MGRIISISYEFMPTLQIPEKLKPLVAKKKRYKILIGGRASAKSQSVADLCLMDSQVQGLKIACFREFQNSIDDSVHALLKAEIERLELQGFDTTANTIKNKEGGEFKFRGLARNIYSIQSMHGFQRFWIEEAQSLSAQSIKILTPTIRTDDSEIWMTANPMSSADPFSQRFIMPFMKEITRNRYYEDDLHLIIKVTYLDNPFLPEVLEQERLWAEKNLSKAEYNHIWLGEFNDTVENSIIKVEWFDAAIDAHLKLGIKPLGMKIASHDPSDTGPDAKGFCLRHGSVILDVQENHHGDVNEGCDWAIDLAIQHQADVFVWDGDGMGVSLRRQVDKALLGKKMEFIMFKGSEGAENPNQPYEESIGNEKGSARTNKETFKNRRAQYAWRLRDRFLKTYLAVEKKQYIDPDTLISISSSIDCIDQLRSEVCRIPQKPNPSGLIQIMTKDEMLRRYKIQSPNLFDSMMMTQIIPNVVRHTHQPMRYSSEF